MSHKKHWQGGDGSDLKPVCPRQRAEESCAPPRSGIGSLSRSILLERFIIASGLLEPEEELETGLF